MPVLPDPPPTLPPAPLAFYDELRALLAALRPAQLDWDGLEVDFGDGGVGVTLPHAREPEWTLGAQVSERAAVVLAGPAHEHFDDRQGPGWTSAAVGYIARVLRGEVELEVTSRRLPPWRPRRTETVRIDFGARG